MVKIDAHISDKTLTAAITPAGIKAPIKYACYLYRGNEIIAKSGYQKENVFSFFLESAGTYHVRGFVRWPKADGSGYEKEAADGAQLSFSPSLSDEYEKFLNTTMEMSLPELPFVKLTPPKQDFLVLVCTPPRGGVYPLFGQSGGPAHPENHPAGSLCHPAL